MAGLIDELVNTMSQENDIYKELIPIADEKTRIIIKNDLDALQKITEKEQLTIERINALEKKREEV
ncbi:MAG: flagellar export chaperone FlgN, partial [Clostridia bacterium]|nr:flagellar export chaperone FlgN [Clostridia bacterium]